jgi:internalin A
VRPEPAEAERRIEEARRSQAERLDLGDLALRELPASLGDLPHLKVLYLGKVGLTAEGNVEWDFERNRPEFTNLSPLARLAGLQSLDLGGTGVADLGPLSGLVGLQNLSLSSTEVVDLVPLSGLSDLRNLDLSGTGVTDLVPLSGLTGLQSLDLRSTGVVDLVPLSGLASLQNLDLRSTGVTDLVPLSGLAGLQSLYLSRTGVTDLAPLACLAGLQSLDLWSTTVTDLVPLSSLAGLQNLNLANMEVADLSPLLGLEELQVLDLYECRPAAPEPILRALAFRASLTHLRADDAVGVPREVLSRHGYDNCLPRLRTYLSELDFGMEAENEVKVILLGNGRVGKTQLCRRFRGQPFDEAVESTHGVQIWRQELRIRTGGEEQAFQVNWWDFGGQDIYHGTHALFLRSRAVFLILWTPHLENRDEYTDHGTPIRNQPLSYWLDYVRSLAGKDSPVVVVQSQCDQFTDRLATPSRPDGFGFFESCSFSARTDLGREILEGHLHDAIRYLLERNGALEIGKGRAEVRRRLYEWRSEGQEEREPAKRRYRTLTIDEFRALCEKIGGIVSWEHALDYFHQTGVVFYRPDLFSNCVVLDQDWALDAVYTVFRRGEMVPLLRESGRFTRADLAAIIWQKYSPEAQQLFLGVMESCGVCFRCGETADGEARYVAPDLLPKLETVKHRLYAWQEESGTPTLRLEYRFFHQAIIRSLMSEIGRQAGEIAEYWKYGLWFKDGRRDTQLLVQFEDISTDQAPGMGALELKAQGRDALGLLREIRKAVFRQKIGEKPEELLTLDGTTVARSALATMIEGRVLDRRNQPVLAAPFAAFFEDREYDPGQAPARGEQPKISIDPQPLTENEKPREVFISYAWGDPSPEGKVRAEVVDRLSVALSGDGFQPVRDRDTMRSGERISSFIARLTRADRVVAVISNKYLKSPYCMYEIYKVWQRCQGDAEEMVQRVVPIVLPEVRIEKLQERWVYIDHWKSEKEAVDVIDRKGGVLDLSPESFMEARLVREFAHHMDPILMFLRDVLMPRDLEVHFEGDFEAVREALRRRLG